MVFQNYALYPHMTVRQNLGYGLKVRKTPKREIAERVERAAQLLGLDELLDRRPGALSGGQRQRVAMGRAIVREPKAFLMDEPLSNLDAKLRVSMRAQLAALHSRLATTTIYVTHDQIEAMTLGHRVAVMRDGRIQQVDTPQELYARPANLYVAAFIGSPAMNLVEAEIEGGYIRFGGYAIPLPAGHTPQRAAWSRASGPRRSRTTRSPTLAAPHRGERRGRRGARRGHPCPFLGRCSAGRSQRGARGGRRRGRSSPRSKARSSRPVSIPGRPPSPGRRCSSPSTRRASTTSMPKPGSGSSPTARPQRSRA